MKMKLGIGIGKRIQEVRNCLGIQQKEMADAVGMNPAFLSELENGVRENPTIGTLYKIASHYNISMDYLVHGIGNMFLPVKDNDEKRMQQILNRVETEDDVLWLMKNSRFFKNSILAYAFKVVIENESVIKTEIMRDNEKGEDNAVETGAESSPGTVKK